MSLTTQAVIQLAAKHLVGLQGHVFDVLDVAKPVSPSAAVNLAKIVSKLSPMVGNLIEFNTCEYLNDQVEFKSTGVWRRQDPGFPDTIFDGDVSPRPGFEVKAWFPLATEITARFKDSQDHFRMDNTYVAMLAWLPEHLIFGKPKIIDIAVMSAASVAKARDEHYHNPPDYLVVEPGDTTARTANLQQTNTNGFKFQGTSAEFKKAEQVVAGWGKNAGMYSTSKVRRAQIRALLGQFHYRLDTNFAKMDRIVHPEIEAFKTRVSGTQVHGRSVAEWRVLLNRGGEAEIIDSLSKHFDIRDVGTPVVE
jgi:hypothetical protein